MPTSTFPAVKAGLVALYQAAPALAGVRVDYGDPGGALEREHVFFGGTDLDGQKWVSVGQFHREEEYGLKFYIHVSIPGDSQQEATERAHVLFGAIETVTRTAVANVDQLAAGLWNVEVMPTAVLEYVTAEGHACVIPGDITCQARI